MSLLPVHGFVLAGGKSSRMGRDKALMRFRGKPMVEIAVAQLRTFCAEVSIVGNRDDLSHVAEVVRESRVDVGPVAGLEAGLLASRQAWALFIPVDVPMMSPVFLRRWAERTLCLDREGCGMSSLILNGREQPAFSLIQRAYSPLAGQVVDRGERRIRNLLGALEQDGGHGWMWMADVGETAGDLLHAEYPEVQQQSWFTNLNDPDQFALAEAGSGPE